MSDVIYARDYPSETHINYSKEILELIENNKSHWIPDSKGGEPNHRG